MSLETVCIELAARLAVDVFRDEYFGWDPARFAEPGAPAVYRAAWIAPGRIAMATCNQRHGPRGSAAGLACGLRGASACGE